MVVCVCRGVELAAVGATVIGAVTVAVLAPPHPTTSIDTAIAAMNDARTRHCELLNVSSFRTRHHSIARHFVERSDTGNVTWDSKKVWLRQGENFAKAVSACQTLRVRQTMRRIAAVAASNQQSKREVTDWLEEANGRKNPSSHPLDKCPYFVYIHPCEVR